MILIELPARKNTTVALNIEGTLVARDCTECREFLPIKFFYKHKKGLYGFASVCMDCVSREGKVTRDGSKEKIKERSRNYYKNNKRKVQLNNSIKRYTQRNQKQFSKQFEKEIRDIYKQALESDNKMVVDHIIPLIHPSVCGLHYPENLQVIDHSTNCSKQNKWDGTYENKNWKTEWRKSL
jgi:hypothetical protein